MCVVCRRPGILFVVPLACTMYVCTYQRTDDRTGRAYRVGALTLYSYSIKACKISSFCFFSFSSELILKLSRTVTVLRKKKRNKSYLSYMLLCYRVRAPTRHALPVRSSVRWYVHTYIAVHASGKIAVCAGRSPLLHPYS